MNTPLSHTNGDSLRLRCQHITCFLRVAVTKVASLGGAASPPPIKPESTRFGEYEYLKQYL
jgi:hypothetical protein